MHGEPDLAAFRAMVAETDACAQRLRCPADVRILIDGEWFGRMRKSVRAASTETLRRPELKRIAVVTQSGVARILLRFVSVATGVHKIRAFPDEASALAWLSS
jgi:hypothetical protein